MLTGDNPCSKLPSKLCLTVPGKVLETSTEKYAQEHDNNS